MQISESLIEKFLSGRCTKAEAVFVSRYCRKHPEAWKQSLSRNWDDQSEQAELPDGYKEQMMREIRKKTFQPRTVNKEHINVRIAIRFAVAAASVLLVCWGVRLFLPVQQKQEKTPLSSLSSAKSLKIPHSGIESGEWQVNTNHTDQKLKMNLEDGSVVTLLPRSSIRYERNFINNTNHKRDIFLQGQAFFDVARDKIRPFTVYAGNMSTTALGTSFSVQESETGVLVKLYSGKVMVHTVRSSAVRKQIFLKPGEQLRYDTGSDLATVTTFVIDKAVPKMLNATESDDSQNMVFDNTALPEVINQLSKHYGTPIFYTNNELSDMYFSGQILKSDSLSVILKVIANMNGLKITQTSDGFIVHPSKE